MRHFYPIYLFLILPLSLLAKNPHLEPGTALYLGNDPQRVRVLSKSYHSVVVVASDEGQKQILQQGKKNNVRVVAKELCQSRHSHPNGVTFKQLLFDQRLTSEKISFLLCDLSGREEELLEDLLYFSYHAQCPLMVKFAVDNWKSRSPFYFSHLFSYFETNTPHGEQPQSTLRFHPKSTVSFRKKEGAGPLRKRNIPVFLIGNNNLTFLKEMVKRLEGYTSDICIIDNDSTYSLLHEYYEREFPYTVLRMEENYGEEVYTRAEIQPLTGDLYLVGNPSVALSSDLPLNFIEALTDLSIDFRAHKVGVAVERGTEGIRRELWEMVEQTQAPLWKKRARSFRYPDLELYWAPVQETLYLVNKNNPETRALRVAGPFTSHYLPWYTETKRLINADEYNALMSQDLPRNHNEEAKARLKGLNSPPS